MEQALQDLAASIAQLRQQQEMLAQQQLLQQQQANMVQHQPHANPANTMLPALKHVKLPIFSGDKDVEELETWLFIIQQYLALHPETTAEQPLSLAGMQLRGQAATWWRDIRQKPYDLQPQDWNAFADELKRMFMPVNRVKLAREKLASINSVITRVLLHTPPISESCSLPYPDCQKMIKSTGT